MASLKDLFISKTRVKLLDIFLSNPGELFYVRQLTRQTNEEINAVRRELLRMETLGLVKSEKRGNRLYYFFRDDYLFYQDLLKMVAKANGLGQELIKQKNKIGNIKFTFMSGRFIRRLKPKEGYVDVLVVGEVVMAQLAALIRKYENLLDREINYTAMTEEEYQFRKRRRDPFILQVLAQSRVMLIGDEEQLVG
jgi:DNA-binding transcriptional ArsR family regulator